MKHGGKICAAGCMLGFTVLAIFLIVWEDDTCVITGHEHRKGCDTCPRVKIRYIFTSPKHGYENAFSVTYYGKTVQQAINRYPMGSEIDCVYSEMSGIKYKGHNGFSIFMGGFILVIVWFPFTCAHVWTKFDDWNHGRAQSTQVSPV